MPRTVTFPTSANIQVGPAGTVFFQPWKASWSLTCEPQACWRAPSSWQEGQTCLARDLRVCRGCRDADVRNGLFGGCGFSKYPSDKSSCSRVTEEKAV